MLDRGQDRANPFATGSCDKTVMQPFVIISLTTCYIVCLRHSTVPAKTLRPPPSSFHAFVCPSRQIVLPQSLEQSRLKSVTHTDELIIFWMSKVKGEGHSNSSSQIL